MKKVSLKIRNNQNRKLGAATQANKDLYANSPTVKTNEVGPSVPNQCNASTIGKWVVAVDSSVQNMTAAT